MLPHLGPMEIGLIVLLVLVIFGVGKLPQVGGAVGKSIRQFRKAKAGEEDGGEATIAEEDEDEATVIESAKATTRAKKKKKS